jgi:hypothetical protein
MKKLGTFTNSEDLGRWLIFGGLSTLGIDFDSSFIPSEDMSCDALDEMADEAIYLLDSSVVLVCGESVVTIGEWLMCGSPLVELWSVRISDNSSRFVKVADEVL